MSKNSVEPRFNACQTQALLSMIGARNNLMKRNSLGPVGSAEALKSSKKGYGALTEVLFPRQRGMMGNKLQPSEGQAALTSRPVHAFFPAIDLSSICRQTEQARAKTKRNGPPKGHQRVTEGPLYWSLYRIPIAHVGSVPVPLSAHSRLPDHFSCSLWSNTPTAVNNIHQMG